MVFVLGRNMPMHVTHKHRIARACWYCQSDAALTTTAGREIVNRRIICSKCWSFPKELRSWLLQSSSQGLCGNLASLKKATVRNFGRDLHYRQGQTVFFGERLWIFWLSDEYVMYMCNSCWQLELPTSCRLE